MAIPHDKVSACLVEMNEAGSSQERYDLLYKFSMESYRAGSERAIDEFAKQMTAKLEDIFGEDHPPPGGG